MESKTRLILSIDQISVSITKEEKEFFDFLTENGFFREVGHCEFMSLSPSRSNSLNTSNISSIVPHSEFQESQVSSAVSFLNSLVSAKPTHFSSVMLFYIARTYFPNLIINSLTRSPSRSEATKTERSAAWGRESEGKTLRLKKSKQKKEIVYVDPNQTEGSEEFGELDRNELLPVENTVKRKMKTPKISDIKETEIDPILEDVAKRWSDFSIEKAPWLKEKFTPARFYVGLVAIKNSVIYDKHQMTSEGIEKLFSHISKDQFWKNQALSPKQLLTLSKNGVRKIDNILLQMKKKIDKQNPLQNVDLEECPF